MSIRLIALVFSSVSIIACTRSHPEIFDQVQREVSAVTSATEVGVTYMNFREAVTKFATEVDLVDSKCKSEAELAICVALKNAVATYKNSLDVWQMKIDTRYTLTRNEMGAKLRAIVDEYQVEPDQSGRFDWDTMLQAAWKTGHQQLDDAKAKINALR